jgi:hypothetical protein
MEEYDVKAMRQAVNQNRRNLGLPPIADPRPTLVIPVSALHYRKCDGEWYISKEELNEAKLPVYLPVPLAETSDKPSRDRDVA